MSRYCIKCKKDISDDEYTYSMRFFKKALCRRDQPTEEAKRLGFLLEKIGRWKVKFENFDGYKHVDLSIPSAKIDIEVDGSHHTKTKEQALADIKRAYHSYKDNAIITLHIPNILVQDDVVDETARYINDFLEESYKDVQDAKDNWFVGFIKGLFGN
jgi:very-short-patch-repair endonuclease